MLDFFSPFLLEYDARFKYIFMYIDFSKIEKQIFMFIHALKSS